jgi:hypothetical protein
MKKVLIKVLKQKNMHRGTWITTAHVQTVGVRCGGEEEGGGEQAGAPPVQGLYHLRHRQPHRITAMLPLPRLGGNIRREEKKG